MVGLPDSKDEMGRAGRLAGDPRKAIDECSDLVFQGKVTADRDDKRAGLAVTKQSTTGYLASCLSDARPPFLAQRARPATRLSWTRSSTFPSAVSDSSSSSWTHESHHTPSGCAVTDRLSLAA